MGAGNIRTCKRRAEVDAVDGLTPRVLKELVDAERLLKIVDFVERGGEAEVREPSVSAEFVVAASQVLDEGMAGDRSTQQHQPASSYP